LFTDEKHIYSAHTVNPKESPSVRKCSNQAEGRRDKTPAHTINVQTVTDGTSRRVTNGQEHTSLILTYTESRLLKAVSILWCCYNSFCQSYVRSQASSPSFSRTAQRTWCL